MNKQNIYIVNVPVGSSLTSLSVNEVNKLKKLAKKSGLSVRRYLTIMIKENLNEIENKPLKLFKKSLKREVIKNGK